mmetsp:Transcript_23131/g.28384  ORF Transcript_23131/g.28384 Transcript_23131/m.28384 type:complete len:504 (-) Transcript_23131:6-1517(-)
MICVGLEDLVLQVLLLDLGEPSVFLTKAVNPPSALAIKNSLKLLEGLGAVECDWNDDNSTISTAAASSSCEALSVTSDLTSLGFHLSTLPVDPRVGKMMIYGALFRCIDPALTIAASMSSRNPFMSPFDKRDIADAKRREFSTSSIDGGSDHLATLDAFNQYRNLKSNLGKGGIGMTMNAFLRDNFLSRMTLQQIDDLRKQFAGLLLDIGFLPRNYRHNDIMNNRNFGASQTGMRSGEAGDNSDIHNRNGKIVATNIPGNENSSNLHLVKAVLCAGLYPNILIAPRDIVRSSNQASFVGKKEVGECVFRSLKGDVHLHPCTILFKAKELQSRYCCYHEIVKTSKIYVRDCTVVSEFALLLFGGSLKVFNAYGVAAIDDWLKFRIAAKPATLVKYLRVQMEAMLLQKIIKPDDDVTGSPKGMALIQAISVLLETEDRKECIPVNQIRGDSNVRPGNQRQDGNNNSNSGKMRDDKGRYNDGGRGKDDIRAGRGRGSRGRSGRGRS